VAALQPLLGAVSVEAMRQANFLVDNKKVPARRAARVLDTNLRPARTGDVRAQQGRSR
jgi:hypothetical protein